MVGDFSFPPSSFFFHFSLLFIFYPTLRYFKRFCSITNIIIPVITAAVRFTVIQKTPYCDKFLTVLVEIQDRDTLVRRYTRHYEINNKICLQANPNQVENVLYRQRKSLATGARAPDIFRVIAPKAAAAAVIDTVDQVGIVPMAAAAAAAVRNATSVGRLVILPAIAAKVEEGLGLRTAVLTVEAVEVAVNKLATLAVDMVTWLETVRKVKNATTVNLSSTIVFDAFT